MSEKLLVPNIGDFENVEVIEILVKEGQQLKKNDAIITIESDKSSVEIPTNIDGIVEKINLKIGDKVSKGDLILNILPSQQNTIINQDIPKNTESLIKEAERSLVKSQDKIKDISLNENIEQTQDLIVKKKLKKKSEFIQVNNENDIDPVETNEWLESLSSVIENDGNNRAHYLIKELINKA